MAEYTKITINQPAREQSEILIALLSEMGFDGFSETPGTLEAYVATALFDQNEAGGLLFRLGLTYSIETIKETNWNEEWEKNFMPVQVEDFCMVRAPFHPAQPGITFDVVIQPKMSFGTGHHATTQLMIGAMRSLPVKDAAVLDLGTGTGLLAIIAEKMGAGNVLAIDNDHWSIQNARENIEMNDCERIVLQYGEGMPAGRSFGIILANINRNVLLNQLPSMAQQLQKEGVLVISGLLEGDLPVIRQKMNGIELIENKVMTKDGWVAIKYLKR
jgi:ribosomal protein L11 methyltransferase